MITRGYKFLCQEVQTFSILLLVMESHNLRAARMGTDSRPKNREEGPVTVNQAERLNIDGNSSVWFRRCLSRIRRARKLDRHFNRWLLELGPGLDFQRNIQSRFREYVLGSLARRRELEHELAQIKYPALLRPQLGIVADMQCKSELPVGSPNSVSIIITNFNYRQYLPISIRSVLAQTHRPLELIVIDDASIDGSVEAVQPLLTSACDIDWQCVAVRHNIGLPAARNLGINLSRSEFVFILDADNHLLPDCIAAHVEAAHARQADAVYSTIQTFGAATKIISDVAFSAARLARGPCIDAMALFRRSVLLDAGLYSLEPVLYGWEDFELWLRFASQNRVVMHIPRILSHYRSHDESMINIASLDTRGAWIHLFEKYSDIFGIVKPEDRSAEAERRNRETTVGAMISRLAARQTDTLCGCDGLFLVRAN